MHGTEDECRDDDGHPVPFAVEELQQRAEYGTAEDEFLHQRGQNANGDIAERLAHDALEELLSTLGQCDLHALHEPLRRQDGAKSKEYHPYQRRPRPRGQPVALDRSPVAGDKKTKGEDAADGCGSD